MCRKCWVSRLSLSPLGLERVHLRGQLADVPSGCLVVEAAFAPLMSQLKLSVVARSADPAGRSAEGMARRDGRKFLLRV
jgi:hypothetical protein